jgi:hypothetical protein
MSDSDSNETCDNCGEEMEKEPSPVNIIGTRDGFGIGMEFYDTKAGKVIDNYKDWEKAGYRQAKDYTSDNEGKEKLREGKAKRKGTKQIDMTKYKYLSGGKV